MLPRNLYELESFATVGDWTVLGNDTDNLAVSTTRLSGTGSLEFDKVDGAAGTVHAGAYKTLVSKNWFHELNYFPEDRICASFYVSATTDIDYAWVRIGKSASVYAEWRFEDTSMLGAWNAMSVKIGNCYLTGALLGLWGEAVDLDYMAVGVAFDAQDDTLADIKFDRIWLDKAMPTVA